jgi:hypothetical protein
LVVVDLADPKCPKVASVIGSDQLDHPRAVAVQFRYAFVCDNDGLKVLDITDLATPQPCASLPLPSANNVYLARNYAYVSGGAYGMLIVDITNPESPTLDQTYTADGKLCDVRDIQLGITYNSQFAYVAGGKKGLQVVQLTSPKTPGNDGFLARPFPYLIASYKPHEGRVLAVSRGVDRDRAVDESGNQLSVFGRVGARPLNFDEQRRLYIHNERVYRVTNNPRDPIFHYQGPAR